MSDKLNIVHLAYLLRSDGSVADFGCRLVPVAC